MATKAQLRPMPDWQPPVVADCPATGRIVCVPWRDMTARSANWNRLAETAAEPNPFFESWYLLPSLNVFDPEGDVHILRYEQGGKLRGLLPVARTGRYYHLPIPNLASWLHANCFLGTPLVETGYEVPFWQALLGWSDDNAGMALFLHLRAMPLAGPVYAALQGVLAGGSRQAAIVHREERALLASDLDADAYWQASLSSKKRKELRRQLNRLSDEGRVAFVSQADDTNLAEWIEQFLVLESAGWKGRAGSALATEPRTATLFRESLIGAATHGKLERLTLTLNDRPIAMLASFLASPGAFSFKTAFDEQYARFSPGVLLQRENLAMLDRENIAWCDSCAASDHPMIDRIWRERRAIGRISIAIGGPLRRAAFRQIVRRETTHNPAGGAS